MWLSLDWLVVRKQGRFLDSFAQLEITMLHFGGSLSSVELRLHQIVLNIHWGEPRTAFFFLFLKMYLFFNWRIIALPNFVVFCQTSTWISHRYIYIYISPPFWSSLPSPSPSHHSRLIQNPCLSFLRHTANSYWLSIVHMVREVSITLSIHLTISPISVSIILFSMSVSPLLPCK